MISAVHYKNDGEWGKLCEILQSRQDIRASDQILGHGNVRRQHYLQHRTVIKCAFEIQKLIFVTFIGAVKAFHAVKLILVLFYFEKKYTFKWVIMTLRRTLGLIKHWVGTWACSLFFCTFRGELMNE